MHETYLILSYVLNSRRYRNVYVRKADRELFNTCWELWPGCVLRPRLTPYGKNHSMHKCYVTWEEHPEKKGKSLTSVELEQLIKTIKITREICQPDQ